MYPRIDSIHELVDLPVWILFEELNLLLELFFGETHNGFDFYSEYIRSMVYAVY